MSNTAAHRPRRTAVSPSGSAPLTGAKRLVVRRTYRKGREEIAAAAFAHAFSVSTKIPGAGRLSVEDCYPLFVAAMQRELSRITGRAE